MFPEAKQVTVSFAIYENFPHMPAAWCMFSLLEFFRLLKLSIEIYQPLVHVENSTHDENELKFFSVLMFEIFTVSNFLICVRPLIIRILKRLWLLQYMENKKASFIKNLLCQVCATDGPCLIDAFHQEKIFLE